MYLNLSVFYFNVCFLWITYYSSLPQSHKHSLYSLLRGFFKKRQISEVSTSVISLEKGTVCVGNNFFNYLLNIMHCTYIIGYKTAQAITVAFKEIIN